MFSIGNQYELGRTIGSGGFAKVKLATHAATGEKVAIKIMNKHLLKDDLPRVYQEIKALKSLSHTGICKLYQVVETETHFFLVMEYCCGGELFDHIVLKERLEEEEARVFFRQIVGAVAYCHRLGYAHRDLKPENILLDNEQNLKIVDFGLCVRPLKGVQLHTSCGSPNYAAPELLRGEKYFGPEIDIWSLGVLLYALLCGNLPFEDDATDRLYTKILRGKYDEPQWLSEGSKDLISALLRVNPKSRLTTQELCDHPWLNKGFNTTVEELSHREELFHRDEDCLDLVGQALNQTSDTVWSNLQKKRYDYVMATYQILLTMKQRNKLPRKLRVPLGQTVNQKANELMSPEQREQGKTFIVESVPEEAIATPVAPKERGVTGRTFVNGCGGQAEAGPNPFATPRNSRRSSVLGSKRGKRIRSPGLDDKESVPKKKVADVNRTPVQAESERRRSLRTPISARRVFDGIERGIRHVLTPRRNLPSKCEPAVLTGKNMANVTSINGTNPHVVLNQLQKALLDKGIECTVNGFVLCGKLKKNEGLRQMKLSFELEVCWVPQPSASRLRSKTPDMSGAVLGIRRKRLRGDAWIYKCVCEEVLAVAAL